MSYRARQSSSSPGYGRSTSAALILFLAMAALAAAPFTFLKIFATGVGGRHSPGRGGREITARAGHGVAARPVELVAATRSASRPVAAYGGNGLVRPSGQNDAGSVPSTAIASISAAGTARGSAVSTVCPAAGSLIKANAVATASLACAGAVPPVNPARLDWPLTRRARLGSGSSISIG